MPDNHDSAPAAPLLTIPDALTSEAAAMLLGGNVDGLKAVQEKLAAAIAGQGVSGADAGRLADGWVRSFASGVGNAASPDLAIAEAGRITAGAAARMAQALQDAGALTGEQRLAAALAQGQGLEQATASGHGSADLNTALFNGVMDQLARPAGSADPMATLARALNEPLVAGATAPLAELSPMDKLTAALASGAAVPEAMKALGPDSAGLFAATLEQALANGEDAAGAVAAAAERAVQGAAHSQSVTVEQTGGDRLLTALAAGGTGAVQGGGAFTNVLNDALAAGATPDAALQASAKAQADMAVQESAAGVVPTATDALVASLASGRNVAETVKTFAAAASIDPAAAGGFGLALGTALSSGQEPAGALGVARQDVVAAGAMASAASQGVKSDGLVAALASGQNVQQAVQAVGGGGGAFSAALGQALAEGRSPGQALAAARQVADTVQQNSQDSEVPVSPENKALAELAAPSGANKAAAPDVQQADAQQADTPAGTGAASPDGAPDGADAKESQVAEAKDGAGAETAEQVADDGTDSGDKGAEEEAGKEEAEAGKEESADQDATDADAPAADGAPSTPAAETKPTDLTSSAQKPATFGPPDVGGKSAPSSDSHDTAATDAKPASTALVTSLGQADPFATTAQNQQRVVQTVTDGADGVTPGTPPVSTPPVIIPPVIVQPLVQAPTLASGFDAAALAKALAMAEGTTAPAGFTVFHLIETMFRPGETGSSVVGVAVVANGGSALGVWQYSVDGATWLDVGAVGDTAALVLPGTAMLRFLPATGAFGVAPALGLRAVNDSWTGGFSDASHRLFALTGTGGTYPLSSEVGQLSLEVTPVNGAPVATGAQATLIDIVEDNTAPGGATVSSLFGSFFSDPTDAVFGSAGNGFAGVAVIANAATATQGKWEYWSGSAWVGVGTVSGGSALLLSADTKLRFLPTADWNGVTPALTVRLVDDSLGPIASGDRVNLADGVGGITRYSDQTIALTQTVSVVNDAPVATGSHATLTAVAEDMAAPDGATVSSLFGPLFSDPKDAPGSAGANKLAGIAIVGGPADAAQGVWQYWNGSAWTDVGAVSEGSALLVRVTDKLRFLPGTDWNGDVPTLTVRLVDDSSGALASGKRLDLTKVGVGGTSAYSENTITLDSHIIAVNDAPVATGTTATMATIAEDTADPAGATVSTLFQELFSDAADAVTGGSAANVMAGVVVVGNAATGQGVWQYWNGAAWVGVGTVSNDSALLLSADTRLRFLPADDWNGVTPALTVRLVDDSLGSIAAGERVSLAEGVGGATRYSAEAIALTQTVSVVNDAPVATGNHATLAAVAEDAAAPAGATVSSLFGALFSDPKDALGTAGADALGGIAIVGGPSGTGQGVWQYWNGSAWTDVGAVSEGSALIVRATDKLRFLPAEDWNGTTPALTVRLVDDSSGALVSGGRVDLAQLGVGGTSPYSAGTITLDSQVGAVNDAPVATGTTATMATIAEDTADPAGATVSTLFQGLFSDAADAVTGGSAANALTGVAVVGNMAATGQGVWQYWSGSAWVGVGTVSNDSALLLSADTKLRFLPAADWNGVTPALTVRLVDGSLGAVAAGDRVSLAEGVGGTTRYSLGTIDLAQTVSAVNDAPVATGTTATMAAIAEDTASPAGATLSSLFGALFSDAADAVSDGSTAGGFAGVAIVGNAASSAQGVWQYWTGSGWAAVGTVSEGSALVVTAASKLRFVPAEDWHGTTPALTVRLIEQSSASTVSGTHLDLTGGVGGNSHYSAGTITLTGSVTAVNDAPEVTLGSGALTILKDSTVAVTGLSVSDVDAGSTPLLVTLSAGHGTLTLANGGLDAVITGNGTGSVTVLATLATINALLSATNGLLYATASYTGSDSITIEVNDQGGSGSGGPQATSATVDVTVRPPNASPVLNDTDLQLSTVAEALAAPDAGTAGIAVSKLVGLNGAGAGNVTDSDPGAVTGIALVGADESYGQWWYSTNNGTTWTLVGTVNDSDSALLLRSTDRLYFQPNALVPGSIDGALTIRAWDQTTGSHGSKVAVSTGAGSAFSTATDGVTLHPGVLLPNGSFDDTLTGWTSTGGTSVGSTGDGHEGTITSAGGKTPTYLEDFLGLSHGAIATATGTTPSLGHAMKLSSTVTVTQDMTLTFDWSFTFSDPGYHDFGFVSVNGVVTLLAKDASASGTFTVVVPANTTLSLGFGSSDTSDNSVNPILRVDNIRLSTVADHPVTQDLSDGGMTLRSVSEVVGLGAVDDGSAVLTGYGSGDGPAVEAGKDGGDAGAAGGAKETGEPQILAETLTVAGIGSTPDAALYGTGVTMTQLSASSEDGSDFVALLSSALGQPAPATAAQGETAPDGSVWSPVVHDFDAQHLQPHDATALHHQ